MCVCVLVKLIRTFLEEKGTRRGYFYYFLFSPISYSYPRTHAFTFNSILRFEGRKGGERKEASKGERKGEVKEIRDARGLE